jgi:hypothetical protein
VVPLDQQPPVEAGMGRWHRGVVLLDHAEVAPRPADGPPVPLARRERLAFDGPQEVVDLQVPIEDGGPGGGAPASPLALVEPRRQRFVAERVGGQRAGLRSITSPSAPRHSARLPCTAAPDRVASPPSPARRPTVSPNTKTSADARATVHSDGPGVTGVS